MVPDIIVTNQLCSVTGPVDEINFPSNSKVDLSYPEDVPGLYASRHCQQNEAKARILEALQLGHAYLRRRTLLKAVNFSRSDLTKSKVIDVLQDLERLMGCVKITHDSSNILGIAPDSKYIEIIPKKLTAAKNKVLNSLLENGMVLPSPPIWGKENNPEEWWSINDFEILAACYQHEVEYYLKVITTYLPKGKKSKSDVINVHQTLGVLQNQYSSATDPEHTKKPRNSFSDTSRKPPPPNRNNF